MIQLQVLNKVLQDKSLALLNNNGITSEYFSDYGPEYQFIIDHVKEYGNVPDDETILEQFPGFELLNILETDQYLVDKIREEHLYDALVHCTRFYTLSAHVFLLVVLYYDFHVKRENRYEILRIFAGFRRLLLGLLKSQRIGHRFHDSRLHNFWIKLLVIDQVL